jgi:hypothetical protein
MFKYKLGTVVQRKLDERIKYGHVIGFSHNGYETILQVQWDDESITTIHPKNVITSATGIDHTSYVFSYPLDTVSDIIKQHEQFVALVKENSELAAEQGYTFDSPRAEIEDIVVCSDELYEQVVNYLISIREQLNETNR